METVTEYKYIVRDKEILGGEPVIKGTRTPVRAIVENWRLGLSPEEIVIHISHLTLAQVFESLSYYSDHQEEINEYIEKNQIPIAKIHSSNAWSFRYRADGLYYKERMCFSDT